MRTVLEIASQNAGYVTAAQVTAAGIPRRKLAEVVRSGEVVQLTRGLYALPDVWGSSHLRVWGWYAGFGVSWPGRGRGLPMMGVPTPSIRKTSTCLILPLIALT